MWRLCTTEPQCLNIMSVSILSLKCHVIADTYNGAPLTGLTFIAFSFIISGFPLPFSAYTHIKDDWQSGSFPCSSDELMVFFSSGILSELANFWHNHTYRESKYFISLIKQTLQCETFAVAMVCCSLVTPASVVTHLSQCERRCAFLWSNYIWICGLEG